MENFEQARNNRKGNFINDHVVKFSNFADTDHDTSQRTLIKKEIDFKEDNDDNVFEKNPLK